MVVRGAGLEPARYFYHEPLKLACLPFHHPRTDSRDASAALVIISWPRSPRGLVHQNTKAAAVLWRAYGRGFGAAGLAGFAGAGAPNGAGAAGADGIAGAAGTTTFLFTVPPLPEPKILPVKRRVEAYARKIEVAKNSAAIPQVALVSTLPAPVAPNTVWLEPPNTAPICAPLPC